MTYQIRDHEAGNIIDEFTTIKEAQNVIKQYISEDKRAGDYTPDFYEVYNTETEEVIETA